jgi:hypothetical protein
MVSSMTTPPTSPNAEVRDLRRTHEHGWAVESAHSTSDGRVLYVRCLECGARRVDLERRPETPPSALTHPAPARVAKAAGDA